MQLLHLTDMGILIKPYSFDGNNSYVEIPWSGTAIIKGDITIERMAQYQRQRK